MVSKETKKFEMLWYVLPMCYLTIQCDKQIGHKNAELDLDPDGGTIYLFNEEGEIVDSLTYPEMQAPNVSYGMDEETGEFGEILCSNVISIKKSNSIKNHFLQVTFAQVYFPDGYQF